MSTETVRRTKSTVTLLVSGFLGTPLALLLLEALTNIIQSEQFASWVQSLGVSASATVLISTIIYQILGFALNKLSEKRAASKGIAYASPSKNAPVLI